MGKRKHMGSSFDDFLEEDGILSETSEEAIKRVLAWHIAQAMEAQHLSQAEMARRMHTSRASLKRLLDPKNSSVTLRTMHKAATVLGKELRLELVG